MSDPTAHLDWLNDNSEYQQCFVCGQRNPCGLRLRFRQDGARVVADFTGDVAHQGFPGVLHGGVLASILDETLGRVSLLDRRWTMTARLELRYRAPARIGVPLRVWAEVIDARPRLVRARGWISPPDAPAAIICEAEGSFMPLPDAVRDQAVAEWPSLASFFDLPAGEG
jgi:acyl-coenzyme A thioesterase PaaI-like protein